MLLDPPNFLVLDEPTNHLDLATKEMLVTSLSAFEGTMMFVSHDRMFLRGLSNRVLELGGESGIEAQPHAYPGFVRGIRAAHRARSAGRARVGRRRYASALDFGGVVFAFAKRFGVRRSRRHAAGRGAAARDAWRAGMPRFAVDLDVCDLSPFFS